MNRRKYHPRIVRVVIRGYLFSAMWGDGFGLKLRVHKWHKPSPFFTAKRPKAYTISFQPGEWDAIILASRHKGASAYDFMKHTIMAAVNRLDKAA